MCFKINLEGMNHAAFIIFLLFDRNATFISCLCCVALVEQSAEGLDQQPGEDGERRPEAHQAAPRLEEGASLL